MWKILVVDDDVNMREMLTTILSENETYNVSPAKNAIEAIDILKKEDYDIIISDYKMPHLNGVEFLKWVKKYKKNPYQFIIMTAYGEIETVVEAMKLGAYDFIEKNPANLSNFDFYEVMISRVVSTLSQLKSLKDENRALNKILSEKYKYIGTNSKILQIEDEIDSIANTRASVLITGETGTGKDLIAKNIHYKSLRATNPFIKINCAAIPENLIESELFGYEKGSFTGALKSTKGKFELASGGTILLDEIGEMPLNMQSKLLRVLQERELVRIGGSETINIDVRVIATTNRDLIKEIEAGNFREDLYYRLNVITFHLPPLRDRLDDLEQLIEHFIMLFNNENGLNVKGVSEDALLKIKNHKFPGNIRELSNIIERAVIYTKVGEISLENIKINGRIAKKSSEDFMENSNDENVINIRIGTSIPDMENILINKTLEFVGGNKNKAADILKVTSRTLRNKLNQQKLEK